MGTDCPLAPCWRTGPLTSPTSSDTDRKKTPLYDLHVEHGGKMVDFAGWSLPVHYATGIMAEHRHCREQAGLFDVSHMGQVTIAGGEGAAPLSSGLCLAISTG